VITEPEVVFSKLTEVDMLRRSLDGMKQAIASFQTSIAILGAVVDSTRVQLHDATERLAQLKNENQHLRFELMNRPGMIA
jgi:hypothetical protein